MKKYEASRYDSDECSCYMARDSIERFLVVTEGSRIDDFNGEYVDINGENVKKCALDVHNSKLIREIFPFTAPVSADGRGFSLGLGDRLGIASAGHIRAIRDKGVFPILAQQSIRELNLTGRTYDDVLADATWAVLQEGYENGYGADGDHLKTREEVLMALNAGFSMITLDCSDYIGKVGTKAVSTEHMNKYRGEKFTLKDGLEINIDDEIFVETMAVYAKALEFVTEIYNNILSSRSDVDFELSIDETMTPTKPEAHFLIAAWLHDSGVAVRNIAPRFCGEFQKGIDYRGDIDQFIKEFKTHAAIANHYGYRLSIHSGSDKFKVFPVIGKQTNLNCHVKTAGTNWLEALKVVAVSSPGLFRELYDYAVKVLDDAKAYYHIYTEKSMAPLSRNYDDSTISRLLDIEESRQILHVTYGFLLDKQNKFRNKFFSVMHENEELYNQYLIDHIKKHLNSLGII